MSPVRDRRQPPSPASLASEPLLALGSGGENHLAAGAPLGFVLWHRFSTTPLTAHPLSVSVASGLGCVAVMVAETRFGPNHGWALFVALAALVVWMLWQRGQRGLGRTHRKRRLQSGGE